MEARADGGASNQANFGLLPLIMRAVGRSSLTSHSAQRESTAMLMSRHALAVLPCLAILSAFPASAQTRQVEGIVAPDSGTTEVVAIAPAAGGAAVVPDEDLAATLKELSAVDIPVNDRVSKYVE